MTLGKKVGGGEFLGVCPSCGHEKMYRRPTKAVGFCQRCHYSEGPSNFAAIHISDQEVAQLRTWPRLIPSWDHPEARTYLMGRGVKKEHPDIMYDPRGRRLYFHIWSPSPEFQPSYHTRGIDEGTGWVVFPGTQKAHYVWGDIRCLAARIVLVEGIFDQIALGFGAVALLGTQLSRTQQSLTKQRDVIVWLDADDAGRDACRKIQTQLRGHECSVTYLYDPHEPSECSCPTLGEVKGWLSR